MTDNHKRTIAIVIPGGIGTGRDNIGVPVLEQIIKFLSADFKVTVFQLSKKHESFKVDGFELIDFHSGSAVVRSIKFLRAFVKCNRKCKFTVVHGFWITPCGFLAVLVAKWCGIKSVVSVLGGDAIALPEIKYGQLRNPLYHYLTLWTIRQASEVNALTHYLKRNLKKAGVQRSDIKIIPWGVDPVTFEFRRRPIGTPVQFLHIASFHPVKDQETLLRTFKIISESVTARLTIIGEGIMEESINSMIAQFELQDQVTILGLHPYRALPHYYHNADILLHTSLSEGQSEVVTEAMSCGVLVCGTMVGLLFDLPDCCISVPLRNHELLAREALRVIPEAATCDSIRELAHRWTAEHTLEWTIGRIKESYEV